MKILQIIFTVNPEAGGVIESVIQQISYDKHSIYEIACLDSSDSEWLAKYELSGIRVYALGTGSLGYGQCKDFVPWLKANAGNYDAILVNGIWQYQSYGTWLALRNSGIPYHVFPHGMLDPWFKRTFPFKHLKKWLYWPWAEYRVLRDAKSVIFTCEEEKILARESFWLYKAREKVVHLGISAPPGGPEELAATFLAAFPVLKGKRVILFMGRLNRKKGCDLLIRAFRQAAEVDNSLYLVMAGPDQVGWQKDLEDLAVQLGISSRLIWPGMLSGNLKWGAFYAADAFCLPSHQENFGIVVAEALSCGLPVLISDKINIWREIKEAGAGLVEEDTEEGCRKLFLDWIGMDEKQKAAIRKNTIECFYSNFFIERTLNDLRELLNDRNSA